MSIRIPLPWLALLGLLACPHRTIAAEADANHTEDEKVLKQAGITPDGPGLLAFFRKLTPSDAVRQAVATDIRRLGDPSFAVRHKATRRLIAAGRVALPLLRAAQNDADLEIASRARRCLETIERASDWNLIPVAAQLLAACRPAGAVEVLLAYLPSADNDYVEEAVLAALADVGRQGDKADTALAAAAADKELARRAAAAFVLGKAGSAYRATLERLLADTDGKVRFHAASALVRLGDKSAVPPLIALLEDGPPALAWQVEDLLVNLAGDQAPPVALAGEDPAVRRKCRAGWEEWWKANSSHIDMARLKQADNYRNLTLVCEGESGQGAVDQSKVWECGRDGKVRWEFSGLHSPNDVQLLPGGRVLVAEHRGQKVTERDRRGKVVWEYKLITGPISAQRLPGGNTFIATYTELFEVTPAGKKVFTFTVTGMVYCAQKLRNGHVVHIKGTGEVVEMDAAGKILTSFNVGPSQYWAGLEVLPNGHFLIAHHGGGRVIEVDKTGKVLWTLTTPNPTWATRLRNGHILVVNNQGKYVAEYDRSGKEVWKKSTTYRPFRARRY
jgi:HEAT repeat protein